MAGFLVWQCVNCGDIYREADGMPEYGVAPATRFADLPHDWTCPSCGAGKADYVQVEDV
jgi:rubredoxin